VAAVTEAELERVNACLVALGIKPLRRSRDHERLLRIAAAERAVAADGQVLRRKLSGHVIGVR
jgi:hypothetical protein